MRLYTRRSFKQLFIIFAFLWSPVSFGAERCAQLFDSKGIYHHETAHLFKFDDKISLQENLEQFSMSTYDLKLIDRNDNKFEFVRNFFKKRTILTKTFFRNQSEKVPDEGLQGKRSFFAKDDENPVIAQQKIKTQFPNPEVRGQQWASENQKFRFFNIGSRQLLKYADKSLSFEKIFASESVQNPNHDIVVLFDQAFSKARGWLNQRQSLATQKAIENYLQKKPYIDPSELKSLATSDLMNKANNDFLILTKEIGKSHLEMTEKEFSENLVAMIRLARSTYYDPWSNDPMVGGAPWMGLPFFTRVSQDKEFRIKQFIDQISQGGHLNIAEISRFNRFGEFSEAVMDTFILRLFQAANDPEAPVHLLMLECDRFTSRLFARYGFKKLARISKEKAEMPEFIMVLDTRSPEFQKINEELEEKSKAIISQDDKR